MTAGEDKVTARNQTMKRPLTNALNNIGTVARKTIASC